ncbi:polymorphic toxin-type HINT domain-containing protein [Streptomyces sp. NPDC089915]|uniref:polymorphic toxin-type HINT domain-containing protein n=1 Tax=Streptomyces sp. NPDC089915 TaxID=3155186 RepID=UPI00342AA334
MCGVKKAAAKVNKVWQENKVFIVSTVVEIGVGFACVAAAGGAGAATGGAGFALVAGCGAIAGAAGAAVANYMDPNADHSVMGQLKDMAQGALWGAASSAGTAALSPILGSVVKVIAKGAGKAAANVAAKMGAKAEAKAAARAEAKAATSGGESGGSCPTPGNSFTAGTLVLMADGSPKQIDDLRPGDKVLATDPETGETLTKDITATIQGEGTKNLVEITVDTDDTSGSATETITATDKHPFWAADLAKWVNATDLKVGQWLRTNSGTHVQVTAIKRWTALDTTVHNLTVADLHTYYVLAGATPVLVHNCGPHVLALDDNGIPVGGHTSGVEKRPLIGQTPHSVYTRTGKDGTPVQNTIYNENGDAVGHFDFKTHPGTDGPHGHVFDTPGVVAGHGPGAPHIREDNLPPGWNLRP